MQWTERQKKQLIELRTREVDLIERRIVNNESTAAWLRERVNGALVDLERRLAALEAKGPQPD